MDLVITGLGMISSVGHDVATACASIRAGLSRPKPIPDFSVLDEETQQAVPLSGYPLDGFAEGFNILGFWIRVGSACLEDLIAYGNLPGPEDRVFWSHTGLIGVTPPVNDARFESDDGVTPEFMKEAYLGRLLEVFPGPVSPANVEVICTGRTGAIEAMVKAGTMIGERGMHRVIVLAVDSYLDPMTLDWLAAHHRLKTANNAVGLLPGEAGASFLLETREAARARGAAVRARLSPGLAVEANHFFSGNLTQGDGLATAVRKAFAESLLRRPFDGPVLADCNGEEWRAYEVGCARVRLADHLSPDARFLFPSIALGDIGAASTAVAVCLAVRSLERGYAGHDTVLVLSSSDHGYVGAVCVSKA